MQTVQKTVLIPRLSPNPSKITAYWRIFLEVKVIPLFNFDLSFIIIARIMPAIIANTGPPITGASFPKNHEGMAMHRQKRIPAQFF